MKRTLFAIAAITLLSCGSGGSNNPTPNTTTYYDVVNWQNDTLFGTVVDANGSPIAADTVFAYKIGSASYIKYEGVQYALKYYNQVPTAPSGQNDQVYRGKLLLNNSVVADLFIHPGKYFAFNQWNTQPQSINMWDSNGIFTKKIMLNMYTAF